MQTKKLHLSNNHHQFQAERQCNPERKNNLTEIKQISYLPLFFYNPSGVRFSSETAWADTQYHIIIKRSAQYFHLNVTLNDFIHGLKS